MRHYNTQTNEYYSEYMPFVLNGVTYPGAWWDTATEADKQKLGFVKVITTNSPADDRFYWVREELDREKLTYVNTPKDLTMVKTLMTEAINTTANHVLSATDWKVIRAMETGTELSPSFLTWRAAVRDVSNIAITGINNSATVDAIANIVNTLQWPVEN